MSAHVNHLTDVFTAEEVARAAGVDVARVRQGIRAGDIQTLDGTFIAFAEALLSVRSLVGERVARPVGGPLDDMLFTLPPAAARSTGISLAVSTACHGAFVAGLVAMSTVGLTSTEPVRLEVEPVPVHLVYLATPGPGGGGGGGGTRAPAPPSRAERKGFNQASSPVPPSPPPAPVQPPTVEEPEPPPLDHEPLPPIIAPTIAVPADARDRTGILEEVAPEEESRGSGEGGGAGTGEGTGMGEGSGPGIGPGEGGGIGGGVYRPGSGIEPPALLREVKPAYTEQGRRQGIAGDVLLEIVVRQDGSVGDIRVIDGLGAGLDQQAVEAVRQWRFRPARRLGQPVDVLVEVAVEFKLR